MFTGKTNIATGFLFLTLFMLYGFFLIFLRDFAPGKEQWIAEYGVGKHFESRLAHAHGNLFALINIAVGLVLLRLPVTAAATRWISGLALAGMLMPLGILSEVFLRSTSDLRPRWRAVDGPVYGGGSPSRSGSAEIRR